MCVRRAGGASVELDGGAACPFVIVIDRLPSSLPVCRRLGPMPSWIVR